MQIFLKTMVLFFLTEIFIVNYKSWASREESEEHKTCANFVANIIVYVPNPFPKTVDDQTIYAKYTRESFDYYVSSKQAEKQFSDVRKPSSLRGQVLSRFVTPFTSEGFDLTPFLTKIQGEAFEKCALVSKVSASQYLRIAFFLNRMESLEENYNDIAYFVDNIIDPSFYSVRHTLWQPCWKKRYIFQGKRAIGKGKKVTIDDVREYYKNLCQENPEKARAFLYYNEHTFLNSLVPYNALREELLRSSITSGFVRNFRQQHPHQPVYLAFLDDDTKSFCTKNKGTLTCYQECIESFYQAHKIYPVCLTSGYSISWNQHPCVSLGVSLDLEVRRSMSNMFSLAPYYPEPNTIIYIPEDQFTLPESFRKSNESSPAEMITLIKDIVIKRYSSSFEQASKYCVFLSEGEIETTMPPRFLKKRSPNRHGEKEDKDFPNLTIEGFQALSVENIKDIRSIPQSHLWPNDWSGYIQDFLQENQSKGINIGGSLIKSGDNQNKFLKSIISSIYTHHSPIDMFLNLPEGSQNYSNFIGFFSGISQDYSSFLPSKITFTYGSNYTKKFLKDKLKISGYLNQISTLDQVTILLDNCYNVSCGNRIIKCAQDCGFAEIKVIGNYIRRVHVDSPLPLIKVKQEEFQNTLDDLLQEELLGEEKKLPQSSAMSFSSGEINEFNNEEARSYLIDLKNNQGKELKEMAAALGYDPSISTGSSALSRFLHGKTKDSPTIVNKLNQRIKERGSLF